LRSANKGFREAGLRNQVSEEKGGKLVFERGGKRTFQIPKELKRKEKGDIKL